MNNYWLSMWVRPRRTIRTIIEAHSSRGILILGSIFALENFFFYAFTWSLGLYFNFYFLIGVQVVLSPFWGYAWIWIMSHVLHYTGQVLKGAATLEELRLAFAWSKVPALGIVLSWLCIIALSPSEAFIGLGSGNPFATIFNCLSAIFTIWALILQIETIREVQNFSFGRAIANILFSWLLFSLPVIVLVFVACFIWESV